MPAKGFRLSPFGGGSDCVGDSTLTDCSVTTSEISDSAVTYAKIQTVTGSRLLGRYDTANGVVQEVALATGLAMDTDNNTIHPLGPIDPQGRLTLTTAVPVTTADVTGAGTVYFTPYTGNRLSLYDGTRWKEYTFTEISLALTLTSGKNYDVFIYDSSGTLTLELSAAWTNDTTRADALTLQNGVRVKSGATTRRYLGTLRASGTDITEDSVTNRFLINFYNKVDRGMLTTPGYNNDNSPTNYTTNSTTWVSANGGTGSTLKFLSLGEDAVQYVGAYNVIGNVTGGSHMGIGEDSTTTAFTDSVHANLTTRGFGSHGASRIFSEGYHFLELLIYVDGGTSTFDADLGRGGGTTDARGCTLSAIVKG